MTGDGLLAAALKRDGRIAMAALLAIGLLAWGGTLYLAAQMHQMPDMAGMRMSHLQMLSPTLAPWSAGLALYLFAMWFVMMVGMMTPSAAPMVLIYRQVAAQASHQRFASAAWFFGGYLAAWASFSLLATLAHWLLESNALMNTAMQVAGTRIGGLILIAAGIYQFLPLKHACLARCRSPLQFVQQHGGFRPGVGASLRLGFLHGLYCVGCCWVLMALLLVVGVMNLLWIAGLALLVLLEKTLPRVSWLVRGAGLAAIVGGLWMLLR